MGASIRFPSRFFLITQVVSFIVGQYDPIYVGCVSSDFQGERQRGIVPLSFPLSQPFDQEWMTQIDYSSTRWIVHSEQ
jgi:hypothetical protein